MTTAARNPDFSWTEAAYGYPGKPIGFAWGFDCTASSVQSLAKTAPDAIWPYVTGSPDIAWTQEQINGFPGARVYRVNQGYNQGPGEALNGDEFDMEAGAWTMSALLSIITARRMVEWSTRVYATWANYGPMKEELAQAGIGKSVWWRIADWNLSEHMADLELHGDVYAGQWASPTSNPTTLVPGTAISLAEANADLNVALRMSTGWEG